MNTLTLEKHCWAEIDLTALRENYEYIRRTVGGPVCAVVKADAYGHGDNVIARVLQEAGAAGFAVSSLGEGRHLRRGGITTPILILGYADPTYAAVLAANDLITTCYSTEYAQALSAAAVKAGVKVKVHLKIDTGMGRIGFAVRSGFAETIRELEALYALPGLDICGVFQHFAVADSVEPDDERYTDEQHALFAQVVERLRADGYPVGTVHCANSAAQLRHPEWRHDMTRAGIILYGLDPSNEVRFPALQPVMSLKSVVTFVKELQPGQSVSYGRTFTADKPMRVATVCVGYADGYPRMLSGGPDRGVMAIRGQRVPVVGRVCMDQTMVDVTDIPCVKMGDEVTVFGPDGGDTADTIAAKTQTINYEVVCGLARRVPRVYKEKRQDLRDLEQFGGNLMARKNIRNFCIIAHIDHGKSTLSDRMLELTDSVDKRTMTDQVLDDMDIEKERGITIKARAVTMRYKADDGETYEFNLIDTPGHVDFQYEVSRSLAACEGAVLVVDASQGVEAQTLANCYLALEHNLEVVPILNKIDLPSADPDAVAKEVEDVIGLPCMEAPRVSAKLGIGVKEVLESVARDIPGPHRATPTHR